MSHHAHRALAPLALRAATPILGCLWAGALVVLGLWVLSSTRTATSPAHAWQWAGIFLIAAGQFVFMVVVADRVFPPRRTRLAHVVEGLAALATIGAALAFALALLGTPE